MGLMGMALDYAREKAPVSVLGSLDWLASAGFVVVAERGGPHESFGNLLVVFERSTLAVRITRDRGQWSIELAPGRGEFVPLNVLLTARDGGTPVPRDWRGADTRAPGPSGGVGWAAVRSRVLGRARSS